MLRVRHMTGVVTLSGGTHDRFDKVVATQERLLRITCPGRVAEAGRGTRNVWGGTYDGGTWIKTGKRALVGT